MCKIRLNILYYVFNLVPIYFLFNLDGSNNIVSIINKLMALVVFVINIYLLYLELLKIINKMEFRKNDYSEIFLYSFYFLSIMLHIVGIYFKELEDIKIGFYMFLFGLIFVNQGTIYYDDKILILGFLKINIKNISNIKMKDKSVLIEYKNCIERKIKFPSIRSAKNFFKF
ncbi:hypothetical protein, partial [Streptobacillus moniliformis]